MAAPEPVLGYLRYRIVNPVNALMGVTPAEVIADLPHLHQSNWTVRAMQQGAPGSVAIGTFTVKLHPPGSEGYAANFANYKLLWPGAGEGLRVEGYLGDSGTLSAPTFAGIITEVLLSRENGGSFELRGHTDAWVAQAQRPYPGEIIHNTAYDTINVVHAFIGNYLVGVTDQFNPYTSANYTSTSLPALTAGTWASATDANGINSKVVSNLNSGTGAILINKTSFQYQDGLNTQIVECIVRLNPATNNSATNAGKCGIGLALSSANANDSVFGYITAKWNATTSRYDLDATCSSYTGGTLNAPITVTNALTNVDDPDGWIPLNLQLIQQSIGGIATIRFVVNGSPTNVIGTGPTLVGLNPAFPFLMFGTPSAGAANAYYTNFLTGYRQQGPTLNAGYFRSGTEGSAVHKFRVNQLLPPTFLDMWTLAATLEGWYWRLTPQTVTDTNSGLCTLDLTTSPGTDHSADVVFEYGRNLLALTQQGNADIFASDLQFNGYADSSSAGIHYGRNIAAMVKYGWLSGVGMSLSVQDFAGLQRQGAQVATNKGTPGGSYVARVLRDPATADKFRELDYITIHDPEMGVNNLKLLVMSRTFTEGSPEETLTLGQYGQADLVGAQRLFSGTAQMAGLFKNR